VYSRKLCMIARKVNGILREFVWSLALFGLPSCQSPHPSPKMHADPVANSADSIPTAPVSGTIRGKSFGLGSARYFVDRRLGYEKIEIKLSAGKSAEHCSAPLPNDSASVWLRRTGSGPIKSETIRIASNQHEAWEVHYQAEDDGQWVGNGNAEALVVLEPPSADQHLRGELSVCFADETKSCVLGTFVAEYCPISIDAPIRGSYHMESNAAYDPAKAAPSEAGDIAKGGTP
jgi:hypothetical protein